MHACINTYIQTHKRLWWEGPRPTSPRWVGGRVVVVMGREGGRGGCAFARAHSHKAAARRFGRTFRARRRAVSADVFAHDPGPRRGAALSAGTARRRAQHPAAPREKAGPPGPGRALPGPVGPASPGSPTATGPGRPHRAGPRGPRMAAGPRSPPCAARSRDAAGRPATGSRIAHAWRAAVGPFRALWRHGAAALPPPRPWPGAQARPGSFRGLWEAGRDAARVAGVLANQGQVAHPTQHVDGINK
jgi:hypothetical protein